MDTIESSEPCKDTIMSESEDELIECPQEPIKEGQLIDKLLNDFKMDQHQKWYLISTKWWHKWRAFVGLDKDVGVSCEKPSSIDNSHLTKVDQDEITLRKFLTEGVDYELIPEPVWNLLYAWYGGGPEISRKTKKSKINQKLRVEVYRLILKVVFKKANSTKQKASVDISRYSKLDKLIGVLLSGFKIKINEIDDYSVYSSVARLEGKDLMSEDQDQKLTLEELRLEDFSTISLVHKQYKKSNEIASAAPSRPSSAYDSMTSNYGSRYGQDPYSKLVECGITGLNNLGNTCFMNSGLQCLSNTPELTDYFLSNRYVNDINRLNPLGMKGRIADEYGELVKKLWSGTRSSVAPSDFKWELGRFAPQFSGYAQQDSQEMIAFLLDGLHEDLNRVKQKPYVQIEDQQGTDEQIASYMWKIHLLRNDSIIVDLFQGQFKSTLVCPNCSKVSITFDPFMYMPLPLPQSRMTILSIYVVLQKQYRPIKYSIELSKHATIADLKNKLSAMTLVSSENWKLSEVYNHRFYRTFQDSDRIDLISSNDLIFAYELSPNLSADKSTLADDSKQQEQQQVEETIVVPVIHRVLEKMTYSSIGRLFEFPFYLNVSLNNSTPKRLIEQIWKKIGHLFKSKEYEEAVYSDQLFKLHIVDDSGSRVFDSLDDLDRLIVWKDHHRFSLCIEWDPNVFQSNGLVSKYQVAHDVHQSAKERPKSDGVSLTACFDAFISPEKLGEDDPWYCPKCQDFVRATKKMDVWSLPKILVVQLKRFNYTKYWRDKLDSLVDFPLEGLDLSDYVLKKDGTCAVYDLFAVSNHYGGMGGGHYTAYAKSRVNGKWYNFDDSYASPADQSSVVSRAAYVLFYRRRDLPQTPLPQVSATPMPVNPVPSKRYDSDSDDSDSEDEKKSTREVEMDEY